MTEQDDSGRVLYDIAIDRLRSQISRVDGIDSKVGVVFGLANGLLVALLAFLAAFHKTMGLAVFMLAGSCFVAYIMSLWLLSRAYLISHWDYRPNLSDLRKICADPQYRDHPDVVREWIADECVTAYDYNKTKLAAKTRAASQALVSLTAQAVLLVLAVVASL